MPSNRRVFLSSLAILTAGAALGRNYFDASSAVAPDLESLWKDLCRRYYATPHTPPLEQKRELPPCNGHTYKEATPVFFPKEQIIAQPVWIFWDSKPGKPADVVIHCYHAGNAIASLNQFELKLLAEAKTDAPAQLTQYLQRSACGLPVFPAKTLVYQRNKTTTVYA